MNGPGVPRRQAINIGLGTLLVGALEHRVDANASAPRPKGLVTMPGGTIKIRALHLFDGDDGESHIDTVDFEPIRKKILEDITLQKTDNRGFLDLFESRAISVNVTAAPPGFFIDWHHAMRRHFFYTVQGIWETGLGDGSLHRVGPGEFLVAEDRKGRGHTSRVVSDGWAVAIDLILDDV